jgi:hypothetical protein
MAWGAKLVSDVTDAFQDEEQKKKRRQQQGIYTTTCARRSGALHCRRARPEATGSGCLPEKGPRSVDGYEGSRAGFQRLADY